MKVLPYLRTFIVLDKEGQVKATNRTDILGFNYSSRDYFINVALIKKWGLKRVKLASILWLFKRIIYRCL